MAILLSLLPFCHWRWWHTPKPCIINMHQLYLNTLVLDVHFYPRFVLLRHVSSMILMTQLLTFRFIFLKRWQKSSLLICHFHKTSKGEKRWKIVKNFQLCTNIILCLIWKLHTNIIPQHHLICFGNMMMKKEEKKESFHLSQTCTRDWLFFISLFFRTGVC